MDFLNLRFKVMLKSILIEDFILGGLDFIILNCFMFNSLILLLRILLGVAFVTLLERKLLSYAQRRKGPNLVGRLGLLQPFRDGIKLLTKKEPHWGNSYFISWSPLLFWLSALLFWRNVREGGRLNNVTFLWLMVLRSLGGILTFLTGWNGGRIYSIIGGLRASAQIVSYEVVLSFFFLLSLSLRGRIRFLHLQEVSLWAVYLEGFFLLLPLWLISILAETNRAPFDLTEGESELVRGFNTEYSAFSFTLLFLGEYAIILAFGFLTRLFFLQNWRGSFFFVFFLLWVRRCFPRKRYDYLITLMWLIMFPLIIFFLGFELLILLG